MRDRDRWFIYKNRTTGSWEIFLIRKGWQWSLVQDFPTFEKARLAVVRYGISGRGLGRTSDR